MNIKELGLFYSQGSFTVLKYRYLKTNDIFNTK